MAAKRRAAAAAMLLGAGAWAQPASTEEAFEVALWANDDSIAQLPNLVSTSDHPCGAVAIMRLRVMPPYAEQQGALGTELVAELGSDGVVMRRWSVPVDYQPLALRGDALLIRHGGRRLWIDTAGALSDGGPGPDSALLEPIDCPADAPLAQSDYRQCAALADAGTGMRRTIVYEASCS